ncbi:MAG: 4-hydroxythreonine-4-phosphate dehydrogenase PdxA [Deltaproteobacteria bacterium]|nr:MAG: 4-hydroxythreonine-4-phosphate dehydrogenase PdxA [Deltaproteobacteria bacterium]PIE73465.1 MAG: 4-hydroxythreonine-4-phosphate dehydrogenase PdxA [Deltaproteobacteria bacterium]
MGCPAGIGPEIIYDYFARNASDAERATVVLGDLNVLKTCAQRSAGKGPEPIPWQAGAPLPEDTQRFLPVLGLSELAPSDIVMGKPNIATARAMAEYIRVGVELASQGELDGIVTAPISKHALRQAGYSYPGHTEMLADLTHAKTYAMMMAGDRLRVTLVTIHCRLKQVPELLTEDAVLRIIEITKRALRIDFGISRCRIAVAGLNPHAGEQGMFGDEETTVISPAIRRARDNGILIEGPLPPDTVFYKAARGEYDAVVCMYHDQGLIPFKLMHFDNGVNVTLGLPIVRTSVDHGTAYDIAGKGLADSSSLHSAVQMAHTLCANRKVFAARGKSHAGQ